MFKRLFLIIFLYCFQLFTAYAVSEPTQESSLIMDCSYSVQWYTVNWAAYSTSNASVGCDMTWITLPDGVFNITFNAQDNAVPSNTMQVTKWPFRIDSVAPNCTLNSIELHWIDNQYYNNWNFYYKSASNASWKFVLDISCIDTQAANLWATCDWDSCVSWINPFSAQTILWDTPTTIYSINTNEEKVFQLIYEWSWYQFDSYDILSNGTFISDVAWNVGILNTNNTNLVFKKDDGTTIGTINNITKLQLVPDWDKPVITWTFDYSWWNDGLLGRRQISTGFTPTFFSALDNREIHTPRIEDAISWLKWYNINIENFQNTGTSTYPVNWSTLTTQSKIIDYNTIAHNFSDVSKNSDYNSTWYRPYSWDIKSLSPDGTEIADYFCDMVWNCVLLTTPELNVVANVPDILKSTSTFNSSFTGNISNFDDEYNLQISFKDKYDNEIVPVSWVKSIKLTNNFVNTLWSDQITDPDSWNWVSIEFTDWSNSYIDELDIAGEYKSFSWTLTNKSDLYGWELKIAIKSAVPTYDEYETALNNPGWSEVSMFWDLTAELRFEEFKIDVVGWLGYEWIWEFETIWNNFLSSSLPEFKFDPLITFNYIWNIYPLVEWQYKNMDIGNIVLDDSELENFDLNIKTSTNNVFLQVTKSSLEVNNNIDWTWNNDFNEYHIINEGSTFAWSIWNWNMENTTMWTFKILPQTIGWITDDDTKIALFSELSYLTNWIQVTLPWIQTWFKYYWVHEVDDFYDDTLYNEDSWIIFSEIKISWITQSNNVNWGLDWEWAITLDNSSFIDFSEITLLDLKTTINKNVSLLIKWEDISAATVPPENSVILINNFSNFNDNQWLVLQQSDVLYIKDRDVNIDCWSVWCWISGKKTIIIENGNLTVNSDLYYTDNNSILWIILIWNESSWDTSQLRINEKNTNWVWVVYSEGPIVSVNNAWEIYDGSSVWENLINQLYWKWSFMTRNTVWWSILDLDIKTSCPYGTPDYEQLSCTQEAAQAYDLIYLRRYARVDGRTYYETENTPMWVDDHKVPLHYDTKDVKIAWWCEIISWWNSITGCNSNLITQPDEYDTPLILDYDSNIQLNPPYGFEN